MATGIPLVDYVLAHTKRGECQCGQCSDRGNLPEPTGHTVFVGFLNVALEGKPDAELFKRLSVAHVGAYQGANVLDGFDHSFQELGAWLGDQQTAPLYMGLGTLLGVFELMDPAKVLGVDRGSMEYQMAARSGFVTVRAAAPASQPVSTTKD